jgi:hypothetical protein
MVTLATYDAADPGGAAHATEDIIATFSSSPAVYKAPLYRIIKQMRDRQAAGDAVKATGNLLVPATGGAVILDTETFTLTNTAAVATVFEFDLAGGGVTPPNVAVVYTGAETDVALAGLMQAAIVGAGINITAAVNSVAATGTLNIPAAGGAAFLDTETFTLTNAAATATVFELDLAGGGVTPPNVAVVYTGAESQSAMASLIAGVINTAAIDITATPTATSVQLTQGTAGAAGNNAITETVADAGFTVVGFLGGQASVDVTQIDPGVAGNVTITETVADGGFIVSGFAGGIDAGAAGGIITLKYSKNDADPVVVLVPQDHATLIGL